MPHPLGLAGAVTPERTQSRAHDQQHTRRAERLQGLRRSQCVSAYFALGLGFPVLRASNIVGRHDRSSRGPRTSQIHHIHVRFEQVVLL